MDKQKHLLLEALKLGVGHGEQRLYRSGKLPGLFAGRTREHASIADEAVREGLLEVVRIEMRGKTPVEWVHVTPRGMDYLLQNEAPVRALEDLRAALDAHRQGVPLWVEELRQAIGELQRRLSVEVESVSQRLDHLARRAAEAIERLEQVQGVELTALPWADAAVAYLDQRQQLGLDGHCSLAELFAALREKQVELSIRDFHLGLRLLHERGLIRLLADDGGAAPPQPEYGLLDTDGLFHFVSRPTAS